MTASSVPSGVLSWARFPIDNWPSSREGSEYRSETNGHSTASTPADIHSGGLDVCTSFGPGISLPKCPCRVPDLEAHIKILKFSIEKICTSSYVQWGRANRAGRSQAKTISTSNFGSSQRRARDAWEGDCSRAQVGWKHDVYKLAMNKALIQPSLPEASRMVTQRRYVQQYIYHRQTPTGLTEPYQIAISLPYIAIAFKL